MSRPKKLSYEDMFNNTIIMGISQSVLSIPIISQKVMTMTMTISRITPQVHIGLIRN